MSKKTPILPLTRTDSTPSPRSPRPRSILLSPSPRRVIIVTPSTDEGGDNKNKQGSGGSSSRYGEGDDYFGSGIGRHGVGGHGGGSGSDSGPALMTPALTLSTTWASPSVGLLRPMSPSRPPTASPGISPLGSPRSSPRIPTTPLAAPLLEGSRQTMHRTMSMSLSMSRSMAQLQLPSPPSSPPSPQPASPVPQPTLLKVPTTVAESDTVDNSDVEATPLARTSRVASVTSIASIASNVDWGWFRSDMFSVLVIMVPLGLAAGICGWAPKTVFTLCAVSLAGLEVFVNTTLERIGIAAVYADATMLAKSFVIGYVLNNILLGTGAALFAGGINLSSPQTSYCQDVSESALDLIKLTLIATGPVMMTWAMIYVTTVQAQGEPPAIATEGIVSLSRGTAVILLVLYLSWVVFRRVTHRADFADDDRGRRVAAELVREAYAAPSKKRRQDNIEATAGQVVDTTKKKRVFDSLPTPAACVVVTTAVLVALASAVVCSYYLVQSIEPLVRSTYEGAAASPSPSTPSSPSTSPSAPEATAGTLKGHFVASIVLPLIVNVYNFMRAAEIASCGGRDVSLAVHMTYGAGANTILLTLPLLVLVGWWSGHTLNLDFQSFDVSILAGSVWLTSILVTDQVDYFRGFILLCLYVMLALAIFLYKE
ncbi:Vacuolar calcium ion transporter [Sporothrix stenoceras]|uniref:Vacuolar calcium ion transporter n=1 Tax=Sporothrix stenoceras TaxID=5173 RepID=A0ABR3Z2B4_9PEZI